MHFSLLVAAVKDLNLSGLPQPNANSSTFHTILSILIGIVAAICLLFITIGGFRYVLSQGDPQGVSKAKGTIIYALVGLIIVIIAQSIVSLAFGRLQ